MKQLQPLTISQSLSDEPTCLLTADMRKYIFVAPVSSKLVALQGVYEILLSHFKIPFLDFGTFTWNGEHYFCVEKQEGMIELEMALLRGWKTKHSYNRILNPDTVLRILLLELYFPMFNPITSYFLFREHEQVIASPIPYKMIGASFEMDKFLDAFPISFHDYRMIQFFRYFDESIREKWEEFLILHHENLYQKIKYQISLFPAFRNEMWNVVKTYFETPFREEKNRELRDYFLQYDFK